MTGSGRFAGKRALITGAARGQGRSHALALAREGANVALLDIAAGLLEHPPYRCATQDDLDESARLVKDLGRTAVSLTCDVRDDAQVSSAVEEAVGQLGGLDFVIANAGVEDRFGESWTIPTQDWKATIDANLNGVWLTAKYTIPHLIQSASTGERACLILISSLAGLRPLPYNSDYVASKFGVTGLGLTLANELGPYQVRCNIVHPGNVNSPMIDAIVEANGIDRDEMIAKFSQMDMLGAGSLQPEESTTPAILWLLSEEGRWINGHSLSVDAGAASKGWG